MHSRLEETIEKHQFPKDIIQEVNEFLQEIMALQLEAEPADEEFTDEPNKNCIANGNENEKGETNGHNDDIHAINLSNAKDFKNKIFLKLEHRKGQMHPFPMLLCCDKFQNLLLALILMLRCYAREYGRMIFFI